MQQSRLSIKPASEKMYTVDAHDPTLFITYDWTVVVVFFLSEISYWNPTWNSN